MRRAGHAVEQVQIIGLNAGIDECLREILKHGRRVVDTRKQHALIQKLRASRSQVRTGLERLRRDLLRVIDMGDHNERAAKAGKGLNERRRHALGQGRQNPGVDAQAANMWDRRKPGADGLEVLVRNDQRIAARENDLGNGGIAGNPIQRAIDTTRSKRMLGIREVTAKAIATMHRAAPRHDPERPPGIFAYQPMLAEFALVERVGAKTRCGCLLGRQRQDLSQKRVVGIAALHQRCEVPGHQQRELRGAALGHGVRGLKPEPGVQASEVAERRRQRLLPGFGLNRWNGFGYHWRLDF